MQRMWGLGLGVVASLAVAEHAGNTTQHVALTGSGLASLTFRPWPVPEYAGAFEVTFARYDFNAADPVPEPASMLLLGSGLAGLAAVRRRRRPLGHD